MGIGAARRLCLTGQNRDEVLQPFRRVTALRRARFPACVERIHDRFDGSRTLQELAPGGEHLVPSTRRRVAEGGQRRGVEVPCSETQATPLPYTGGNPD